MHGIRVTAAATGAALLAVLAAGCGSSGGSGGGSSPAATGPASAASTTAAAGADNGVGQLSAPEALQRAVRALKDAGAVRAVGTVSGGGSQISMDLRMDTVGSCTGTLTQSGTGSFQVVKSGQQLWVKPDLAFWQSHGGSAAAELVGDRYLKTTADNADFAEIGDLCNLGTLADQIGTGKTDLAKGAPTTVQGRPALTLTNSASTGTGTLYVASTGSPVPLRLEKATGTVDFSDFGTPVPTATPGPAQSLDLDQLQSPAASASV
ncbi:hypothetical protein [Kitasatospora sp. NPDC088134]|uniref:hypothetical protein n=1 Tax=Kitasatospora sp. NPDC088134 TaxID=3364071 RepID=UPI0037F1CA17